MKYYAVRKGETPGIYLTWEDCKEQVNGYPNAEYKSFGNLNDAINFIAGVEEAPPEDYPGLVVYTDGSYLEDNDIAGYGIVALDNGKVMKTFNGTVKAFGGRQVNGEIQAVKVAVEYAIKEGYKRVKVCHDYKGIQGWAEGYWKANKEYTAEFRDFIESSRKQIKVDFEQVPAHSGITYNEEADRLAKMACENGGTND